MIFDVLLLLLNRADFVIVLGTVAGFLVLLVIGSSSALLVNILRVFRVTKVFKLIKSSESVTRLINTVILTLPSIFNIMLLLLLIFFIFAVIGHTLFAKVAYGQGMGTYYDATGFRTFGGAMLVLVRIASGDNWSDVMFDVSRTPEDCVNDPPYNSSFCGFNDQPGCIPLNGCGQFSIFPVVLIFYSIVGYIFLNVFVAIILSNYDEVNSGTIKPDDCKVKYIPIVCFYHTFAD